MGGILVGYMDYSMHSKMLKIHLVRLKTLKNLNAGTLTLVEAQDFGFILKFLWS